MPVIGQLTGAKLVFPDVFYKFYELPDAVWTRSAVMTIKNRPEFCTKNFHATRMCQMHYERVPRILTLLCVLATRKTPHMQHAPGIKQDSGKYSCFINIDHPANWALVFRKGSGRRPFTQTVKENLQG